MKKGKGWGEGGIGRKSGGLILEYIQFVVIIIYLCSYCCPVIVRAILYCTAFLGLLDGAAPIGWAITTFAAAQGSSVCCKYQQREKVSEAISQRRSFQYGLL